MIKNVFEEVAKLENMIEQTQLQYNEENYNTDENKLIERYIEHALYAITEIKKQLRVVETTTGWVNAIVRDKPNCTFYQ